MNVGSGFLMPIGEQPPRIYPVAGRSSFIGLRSHFLFAETAAAAFRSTVAAQHQCLEHGGYILAQLAGDVRGRKIVFVDRIGNQRILYLGPVQQARRIGLIYPLGCHGSTLQDRPAYRYPPE